MSEISVDILEAIRAGDPLTPEQRDELNRNPDILDDLTDIEQFEAKLAYDLDLDDADIQTFIDHPGLALDVNDFALGVFKLFQETRGDQVPQLDRTFFDDLYGDGSVKWRTSTDELRELGQTLYPRQTQRAGPGNLRRDDLQFLVALSNVDPDKVFEGLELLAESVRPSDLKQAFGGLDVPINIAIEQETDTRATTFADEHPELSAADAKVAFEAAENVAAQQGGDEVVTAGGVTITNFSIDEAIRLFGISVPRGVPSGLSARRDGEEVRPKYGVEAIYKDDDGRLWSDKPLEVRMQMQADMVEAGFLTPGSFTAGEWDPATRAARDLVITEANSAIIDWRDVIANHKATPIKAQIDPSLRVFLSPDPATLASDVRNLFLSQLGRQPTAIEMAELADELQLNHRLDFEANLADARAQGEDLREQTVGALREGFVRVDSDLAFSSRQRNRDATIVAPDLDFDDDSDEPTSTVQDVDPRSRLEASFFAKYGPLIDYRRQRNDATEAKSNLMTSVLNLDALIRSGTGF